jgi:cation transport ATPase
MAKRNEDVARNLEEIVKAIDGVDSSHVNIRTGSLTVYYDPQVLPSSNPLLHTLHEKGYYDPSQAVSNDQYIKQHVSQAGQFLSKTLRNVCMDLALDSTGLGFLSVLI